MTQAVNAAKSDIARDAMAALGARDMKALRDLLDPAIHMEWPFAGREPLVHRGIDDAMKTFAMLDIFTDFEIGIEAVHEATGSDIVIVEARSRGTLSDGRRDYRNHYVFVLQIIGDRIGLWREYFNPIEGGRIFGKVG